MPHPRPQRAPVPTPAHTTGIKSLATTADLTPDTQNANRGTRRGRALLGQSLRDDGAGRSILADRHGRVIAGNKTLEQATALRLPIRVVETTGEELVVVHRTDLDLATDPRARRLALADNRIAELDLDWDPAMLKQHVADGIMLSDLFDDAELERLLGEGIHPGTTDEDHTVTPRHTTIQRGDLFQLGPHRVLCGDATDRADVTRLVGDVAPALLCTDPPYGVSYDPAWRHRRDPRQRTAVGRVRNDDRVDWSAAYALFAGDVVYAWHAGVHAGTVATSLTAAGFVVRSQIIWQKQHFAMGRGDYHWQHEPCWYAVRRGHPSHWQGDRTQSTVWAVPNLNPMGGDRTGENAVTGHSTQKPVRLFERPILHHTGAGDAVYDPFVGSGTAVIAAEKTGRVCLALDLEPVYVQATIDRWEAYRGGTAVRVGRASAARRS
jgi:DNA modification methylase